MIGSGKVLQDEHEIGNVWLSSLAAPPQGVQVHLPVSTEAQATPKLADVKVW